jgi:hypothetical protein
MRQPGGGLACGASAARLGCGADRASQGQGGTVAGALHADHVVTAAQTEAASRAIEAALDGEPQPAAFHVLVRQAQREMLRVVPSQERAEPDKPAGPGRA